MKRCRILSRVLCVAALAALAGAGCTRPPDTGAESPLPHILPLSDLLHAAPPERLAPEDAARLTARAAVLNARAEALRQP